MAKTEPCVWTPAGIIDGSLAIHGYLPRTGFDCITHDYHDSAATEQPNASCPKVTCLVCQSERLCTRHTSMYVQYQYNSVTWLAGALYDKDAKLKQLVSVLADNIDALESEDSRERDRAVTTIVDFLRTNVMPKISNGFIAEFLRNADETSTSDAPSAPVIQLRPTDERS